jgi:hypothetical protein
MFVIMIRPWKIQPGPPPPNKILWRRGTTLDLGLLLHRAFDVHLDRNFFEQGVRLLFAGTSCLLVW